MICNKQKEVAITLESRNCFMNCERWSCYFSACGLHFTTNSPFARTLIHKLLSITSKNQVPRHDSLIKKKLSHLVANSWPAESRTKTMSKLPLCFSLCTIVPTLPLLCPPVAMHNCPISNLTKSLIFPVSKSNMMVSFTYKTSQSVTTSIVTVSKEGRSCIAAKQT